MSERDVRSVREQVTAILHGGARVEEHVGERSDEGVQAGLANLRVAMQELQRIVVLLAEELDRR